MKSNITQQKVMHDFNKLTLYAEKCLEKKKFNQALTAIETACTIMYYFNLFYMDDQIEGLLSKISSQVLQDRVINISQKSTQKIIFYDYFPTDNKGLTQQYLMALIELEYEILFITYEKENTKKSERIFLQLNEYEKAKIKTIKSQNHIESVKELFEIVNDFGADVALLHMTPWDVVGVATFACFDQIERFLINLTDHAFWIGKCCSDYILEFRSYGYNISRQYRNISEDKLILMPYYPIEDVEISFCGFPFDTADKKIIFSGGSVYKIYGSTVFFEIIKHIIQNHDDTIFLFAGAGNTKPFEKFITINHFEDRIFLIQERKDITQIFKRCYFYVGTYPIGGGLMTQFAVANQKIPMVFTDAKYYLNYIEPLFINKNNFVKTYTNLKAYFEIIDQLINNPEYKNKVEASLNDLIITKPEFAEALESSLRNKNTRYAFEKQIINTDEVTKLYFQMENYYLHNYYFLFVQSKNIKLLLKFLNIHIFYELIKASLNKIKRKLLK